MELSVVRFHKATSPGNQPWVQARSVVHPDKYLSQCPFILLNEESYAPFSEFPIRSHDGVISMTLVLEGSVEQTDGTGRRWRLEQGDADFSASSGGLLHAVTSGEQGVRFLQLWVNMPPSFKPNMPQRQVVRHEDTHNTTFGEASALLYAGSLGEARAPNRSPWPVTIVDLSLQAGAKASLPLASSERSFAYILTGTIELGRNRVRLDRGTVAWTERTVTPGEINSLEARALTGTRLLLVSSPVIGEHAPAVDARAAECAPPPARALMAIGGARYGRSAP